MSKPAISIASPEIPTTHGAGAPTGLCPTDQGCGDAATLGHQR